jgi:hypothetical protein
LGRKNRGYIKMNMYRALMIIYIIN